MSKLSAGTWVVIVIVLGLVIWYFSNICDPLDGKTPAVIEQFTGVKTLCENRVKDLKEAGINGKAKYEAVQLETNKCIGYLKGVLDQGSGDSEEIKKRLDRVSEKCNDFDQWAKAQLPVGPPEGLLVDLAKAAPDFLKLLDKQEKDRREAVKKSLDGCLLRSWQDISAETGALK